MAKPGRKQPLPLEKRRALGWLAREEALVLQEMLDGYRTFKQSRGESLTGIESSLDVIVDFLGYARSIPGRVLPEDFERWGAHLYQERNLRAGTQRKYQATVRVFFDYLVREPRYRNRARAVLGTDIVQVATPENCIIHRLQIERSRQNDRRSFTKAEIDAFFGTLDEEIEVAFRTGSKSLYAFQRDKALFWAAYKYGLRADEVLGLNQDSFEPNPTFPEFGPYGYVRVFGKNSKWRTVTTMELSQASMLAWYQDIVRPLFLRNAAPGENAFFLSEQGKRLTYSALNGRFRKISTLAGLPKALVIHCLRHTSISEKDMAGLSLETNRQEHGHEYGATTQTYTHHPDWFTGAEIQRIIKSNLHKKS